MNKLLTHLILPFLFILPAFSMTIPDNKQDFCARYDSLTNGQELEKEIILELSTDPANLMAFKNDGGLFNGGVCWWHSRFQRNILYLGIFRPDLPRPGKQAIVKIISQIRQGTSVVVIPGHHNFSEFSEVNKKLIQSELNKWQLYDGVILGSWIDGLKGDTQVEPSKLSKMVGEIYQYVTQKKKIAYEKLQIKGITSHAWLIVGMKSTPTGMEVGFIDSNSPRMSKNYTYQTGDKSFFIKGYGNFVPYLEFVREEQRITDAGKVYCGKKLLVAKSQAELKKEYQLDLEEARRIH